MAPPVAYQRLQSTAKDDEDSIEFREISGHEAEYRNEKRQGLFRHAFTTLLVLSNIILAILWLRSWTTAACPAKSSICVRPQLIYSPAAAAIRYEKKRLWRDIDGPNPFIGKPRPELDGAWGELVAPITIKVSSAELSLFSEGDTSLAFKDGSGHIAEMGVYHELHCIKRIRRYLYLDHYYPNMTEEDRVREDTHIEHCLEYWRESAMCRGDITLGTFFWRDGVPTSRVYTDNECVDWQALDHWARQRKVDMSDYSRFVKDD